MSEIKGVAVDLLTPTEFEKYLNDNQPGTYDELWQNRCGDCAAPCCYFTMGGHTHDNSDHSESQSFFEHDFILIKMKHMTWDENIEVGFRVALDTPELEHKNGLMVCPLNIDSKCLIYEDRPKICKTFKCNMKFNKW